MVGLTVGHYRILEKLGEGGVGVVHKAESLRVGSLVTLNFQPEQVLRAPQHNPQAAAIAPRTLQARDLTSSMFLPFVLVFVTKLSDAAFSASQRDTVLNAQDGSVCWTTGQKVKHRSGLYVGMVYFASSL